MNLQIERVNFQGDNYLHTARIPDFAQILDISFDYFESQIEILYRCSPDQPRDKIVNLWITGPQSICPPPIDDYYYWGKIQRQDIRNLDLSFTNNGKVPIVHNTETYHVFLFNIKSINELRDQKIEEVITNV